MSFTVRISARNELLPPLILEFDEDWSPAEDFGDNSATLRDWASKFSGQLSNAGVTFKVIESTNENPDTLSDLALHATAPSSIDTLEAAIRAVAYCDEQLSCDEMAIIKYKFVDSHLGGKSFDDMIDRDDYSVYSSAEAFVREHLCSGDEIPSVIEGYIDFEGAADGNGTAVEVNGDTYYVVEP